MDKKSLDAMKKMMAGMKKDKPAPAATPASSN
jgi:hypothetical protein